MCELDSTVINDCGKKIMCDYYDKLITCINPADVEPWVKSTFHPRQKKFDEGIISSEDDYVTLVNTI